MRKLLFIICNLIVFGCTEKISDECAEITNVEEYPTITKTLTIDISNEEYNHERKGIWYDKTNVLFHGLDKRNNCIDLFDLVNGKKIKSLCFPTDQSLESIFISDYIFHNPDSIFLISDNFKINLVDSSSRIINRYNLINDKYREWAENGLTGAIEYIVARPYFDEFSKSIILPSTPPVLPNERGYYKSPNMLTYDIEKEEFNMIGGAYPEHYLTEDYSVIHESWWYQIVNTNGMDSVLISYHGSNHVLSYNFISDEVSNYFCRKSNYVDFNGEGVDFDDLETQRKFMITTPYYANMFYHKNLQKYFTTVKHSQEYKKLDGGLNVSGNSRMSIITQDENLKNEQELMFEDNYYSYYYSVFPYSEGLVLQRNNEFNEKFKEDKMVFDFYKL